MPDLKALAGTAIAMQGGGAFPAPNRGQTGLQRQYAAGETQMYAAEIGAVATNCFEGVSQGLDPDDFYEWKPVRLRSIKAAQAQTGETMPDDWQRVYIISPTGTTYIPQGALMKYGDQTWIVYKGKNLGAFIGNAIVRRCNAVVHTLDWYGNVVETPISFAKMGTLGNATHATENTITSKNYMNCLCQINPVTAGFRENTRILLGRTAYAMRGLDDFTREFTEDEDSIHLLSFTIERTEVQPHDNVELGVADYGGFSWELSLTANESMNAGTTQEIVPTSKRNSETVVSSTEHPISYEFSTSDSGVVSIDSDGNATAVGQGEAIITVRLIQNPDISETVTVTVSESGSAFVAFTTTVPTTIRMMSTAVLTAAMFRTAAATDEPVTFTLSGPQDTAYRAETDGNTLNITCYQASPIPLTVTAECDGVSATAEIALTT